MSGKARRILVAVAALALVGGLLATGEAVARARFPEPKPAFVMHPLVGLVRPAGSRTEVVSLDTGKPFVLEINALGLRGKNLTTVEKPAGTFRIFFVGASTTENPNTPEEETFAGLVESRLLAQGKKVQVGNAGVSGAQSAHSVGQVAHRLLALSPDLVCVLDGMNDLQDSLRDGWDPTTFSMARTRTPRFKEWLVGQSRLVAWLDDKLAAGPTDARAFFRARQEARATVPVREPDFSVLRGRARFKANLMKIARICSDEGVRCALMTQPTLLKKDMTPGEQARVIATLVPNSTWNLRVETLVSAVESYNEATREAARERGAILIDLAAAIPKDVSNFADDAHLTAKGNDAVATAILERLAAEGLPPR